MLKELLAYHASKRPVKNAPKEDTAIRLDKFIKARERTAKVIETGKAPTNPGAQVDDDAGSD